MLQPDASVTAQAGPVWPIARPKLARSDQPARRSATMPWHGVSWLWRTILSYCGGIDLRLAVSFDGSEREARSGRGGGGGGGGEADRRQGGRGAEREEDRSARGVPVHRLPAAAESCLGGITAALGQTECGCFPGDKY